MSYIASSNEPMCLTILLPSPNWYGTRLLIVRAWLMRVRVPSGVLAYGIHKLIKSKESSENSQTHISKRL